MTACKKDLDCDALGRLVCGAQQQCKIPCISPDCSGHGECNARGLCICDEFWEGNRCDQEIPGIKIVEGGITSVTLAIIIICWMVLPPLLVIPVLKYGGGD